MSRQLKSIPIKTTHEVVVIDAPKFMTPNDDGYFDTWHISGVKTLEGTTISIFDRYGKLLFYFRPGQTQGWDGNYRGRPMPSNEYWYKFPERRVHYNSQLSHATFNISIWPFMGIL